MEVYLDYAAATPMDKEVYEAQLPYFTQKFYNPSASYCVAQQIRQDLNNAKTHIAQTLGTKSASIVMTAGATEANNLALACVTGPVISDSLEHDSILACVDQREHTLLRPTKEGFITPENLQQALTPQTQLVSIEYANGEIGVIQPLRELAKVIEQERYRRLVHHETTPLFFHADASQAALTCSVNVSSLGVDLMTLSAAKIYGPKQVGLLYVSPNVALKPQILGGGQEGGMRSGTENVAGTIAFAKALELAQQYRTSSGLQELKRNRNFMQKQLTRLFKCAVISGPRNDRHRLPGLLHISFPYLEARRLIILLENMGVYVATGSACAASKMKISHVLKALGIPEYIAQGSLRITLGKHTTQEEITYAISRIEKAVNTEMQRLNLTDKIICERMNNESVTSLHADA